MTGYFEEEETLKNEWPPKWLSRKRDLISSNTQEKAGKGGMGTLFRKADRVFAESLGT